MQYFQIKMKLHTALNCLLLALFSVKLCAAPPVTKLNESLLSNQASNWWDDRYGDAYLNSLSYSQDSIISFKGWQYASYYNKNRRVSVQRRQLPDGPWQQLTLPDYVQTTNDNHNNISIGVSPVDGRLHLSFDHHDSELKYRVSVAGLLTNPTKFIWQASVFKNIQNNLGGAKITPITYPRFITAPDGTFLFEARIGQSGNGESWLWKYNNNASWTELGKFIENTYKGGNANAYFHGIHYDASNRLHATWTWRENFGGNSNHDLMYAFSDDNGNTWRNNAGAIVANTGSSFITMDSNVLVKRIPQNSGLINQEGMTVDLQGRVHVISRRDIKGVNKQIHYWRTNDGIWHEKNTGISTKIWDNRSKIAYDSNGNVYAIMPNLQIASATASLNYNDWAVVDVQHEGRFYHSEPLIDIYALKNRNNKLYVFAQEGRISRTSSNIYVLKFFLGSAKLKSD